MAGDKVNINKILLAENAREKEYFVTVNQLQTKHARNLNKRLLIEVPKEKIRNTYNTKNSKLAKEIVVLQQKGISGGEKNLS